MHTRGQASTAHVGDLHFHCGFEQLRQASRHAAVCIGQLRRGGRCHRLWSMLPDPACQRHSISTVGTSLCATDKVSTNCGWLGATVLYCCARCRRLGVIPTHRVCDFRVVVHHLRAVLCRSHTVCHGPWAMIVPGLAQEATKQ